MTVSIALLDLYARADGFIADTAMASLASRLESHGYQVALLRSVLSKDTNGDVPKWHGLLADYVKSKPFDVIALPRTWDPATIETLRAAMKTDAKLVRLTSSVTAGLDGKFDHVVSEDGLLSLLSGGDATPAQWTKTTAKELRKHEMAPPPTNALTRFAVLPGAVNVPQEGRPTITGPAVGCPFLLDAGKSPIYQRVQIDPTKVQMKGCTFCLDNIGAYAMPTEEQFVGSWMAQLRAIRAQRPTANEVLCTDERPHPFLPALFRAIRDEGLGPVELMIKSRVDWLQEFAGTAVREACTLAAESGSVLHIYLVGFENFEQFHLDLFNKGCTVADNIHAIEILRSLQLEFPKSFEYLKYRAHGVVLFTPWTTPEHLLANAQVMRQVRFHELRSEAILTRLRLYPRVPLHALAEADGLLTTQFDDGRGDRAQEQGYDASAPWRFQDQRTEAVFRVAQALHNAGRMYSDADVLEAASRFIMRWPGLANAPDAAPLAFEQARRIFWGHQPVRAPESVVLLGFDPEIELVATGDKRGCLKENIPAKSAPDLVRAYQAMGLHASIVTHHGLSQATDEHQAGNDYCIIAVAHDAASLEAVLAAQKEHRQGQGSDERVATVMGALMGYPECCVKAFLAQSSRGDNLDNERLTFRRAPTAPLSPLLNRFGSLRLISHHPCTPNCAGSIALAEKIMARIAVLDEAAATWLQAELRKHVLFPDYSRRVSLQGHWEGHEYLVDQAEALDDPRRLGAPLDGLRRIELRPDCALFRYANGNSSTVQGNAPFIVTPGEPLAPASLAQMGETPAREPQRSPSHGLPPLPSAIRQGATVKGYRIVAIGPRDGAHQVELGDGHHLFGLRLRPHDPAHPATIRCGSWGVEVDAPEKLPEGARAALAVFARALAVASSESRR
jgi:hypothetical protein